MWWISSPERRKDYGRKVEESVVKCLSEISIAIVAERNVLNIDTADR